MASAIAQQMGNVHGVATSPQNNCHSAPRTTMERLNPDIFDLAKLCKIQNVLANDTSKRSQFEQLVEKVRSSQHELRLFLENICGPAEPNTREDAPVLRYFVSPTPGLPEPQRISDVDTAKKYIDRYIVPDQRKVYKLRVLIRDQYRKETHWHSTMDAVVKRQLSASKDASFPSDTARAEFLVKLCNNVDTEKRQILMEIQKETANFQRALESMQIPFFCSNEISNDTFSQREILLYLNQKLATPR